MKAYLVSLEDIDGQVCTTVCEGDNALVTMLNNLDKQTYELMDVQALENWQPLNECFLNKNTGLEQGKA